jgi:hypothetical protein
VDVMNLVVMKNYDGECGGRRKRKYWMAMEMQGAEGLEKSECFVP